MRKAVEQYLRDFERKKLEQELEAGYRANAALDRRIHEDLQFADAELA